MPNNKQNSSIIFTGSMLTVHSCM